MKATGSRTNRPEVIIRSYKDRELFQTQRSQKDDKEEKVSHHRTSVTTKEHTLPVPENMNQIRDVTIVTKNSSDVPPPPPPPMPTSESESSSSSWKSSSPALSLASSLNGTPPSCPTPDYDTSSSSSVSSPAVSLSTISRNLASQGKHSSSSQTSVNTHSKPVLNTQSRPPATNVDKTTTATSQTNPKNADAVEMQSIESFRLKNPQSPKPKPPETYFVPAKSKNKTQNSSNTNQSTWREQRLTGKQRPVSVTIGEYPSGVERRIPTRFDFLTAPAADVTKSVSSVDGPNITCQLQSELAQTLSRSNLRKQTDSQDPRQNGISKQTAAAKGTVTVSVNCQHPRQNTSNSRQPHSYNSDPKVTNSANKIHIQSDNNSSSKLPVTSTENKTPVPTLMKPAIRNAADKLAKSLGTNNRVTIAVPNGVKSSE